MKDGEHVNHTALYEIADDLRGLANLGLYYANNEYDRERYEKVLAASARILSALENRLPDEVLKEYQSNVDYLTPLAGAGAAVFRDGKLLLIHRHDDKLWAIPGGAVEVGETVTAAAVRELREETGMRGRVTRLLADDELPPLSQGHHVRVPMIFKLWRGEVDVPYFDL